MPPTHRAQVLFATMVEDVRDTRSPQPLKLKPRNPDKAGPRSLKSIVSGVIAARRYNDTSMYDV